MYITHLTQIHSKCADAWGTPARIQKTSEIGFSTNVSWVLSRTNALCLTAGLAQHTKKLKCLLWLHKSKMIKTVHWWDWHIYCMKCICSSLHATYYCRMRSIFLRHKWVHHTKPTRYQVEYINTSCTEKGKLALLSGIDTNCLHSLPRIIVLAGGLLARV